MKTWNNVPEKNYLAELKDSSEATGKKISGFVRLYVEGGVPGGEGGAQGISVTVDPSTYVMTTQLKDDKGEDIGSPATVDLPLESMVIGGEYDDTTKSIILTLKNGQTVTFSVADLVSGLQTEITAQNPLDADLIDDSNSSNKFVSESEKDVITDLTPLIDANVNVTDYMRIEEVSVGYIRLSNVTGDNSLAVTLQRPNEEATELDIDINGSVVHITRGEAVDVGAYADSNNKVYGSGLPEGMYKFDQLSNYSLYIDDNETREITQTGTLIVTEMSNGIQEFMFVSAEGGVYIYRYNSNDGTVELHEVAYLDDVSRVSGELTQLFTQMFNGLQSDLDGKVDAIDSDVLPSGSTQTSVVITDDKDNIDPEGVSEGQIVVETDGNGTVTGVYVIENIASDPQTSEPVIVWKEIQTENEIVYIPMTVTDAQNMTFTVPYTVAEVKAMLDGGLKVMYRLTLSQAIGILVAGIYDFDVYFYNSAGVFSSIVGYGGGGVILTGLAMHLASGTSHFLMKTFQEVNDSTVTVTNNGAAKGSFTTNQSSASTVDLDYPIITMTTTDPGEGAALPENHYIAVYGGDPIILDYSANEINTGAKWIDGSAIYKKTIATGTLPNSTSSFIAHNITGLSRVIKIEGYAYDSLIQMPLPFASPTATSSVSVACSSTDITLTTGTDRTTFTESYVTLYYTKSA